MKSLYLQERERRRQHMAYVKQLDNRRKFEEREKKRHQVQYESDLALNFIIEFDLVLPR